MHLSFVEKRVKKPGIKALYFNNKFPFFEVSKRRMQLSNSIAKNIHSTKYKKNFVFQSKKIIQNN